MNFVAILISLAFSRLLLLQRGSKSEVEVEQLSQVTEFVKEETESGESVMSVEETESAGAETFQPSPSRTTGRNIPDSLSLPLESQAASTQFWTANSARK